MTVLRAALLTLMVLVVPLARPVPLRAAVQTDEIAKHKINIAGRERMLVQRMAMLTCLAGTGVQSQSALARAAAASAQFDTVLTALRHGDPAQNLPPETNPQIQEQLLEVQSLWDGYRAAVERYIAEGHDNDLRAIHGRADPLMEAMNTAVQQMDHAYSGGLVAAEIANTINVAGGQRMLLMKLVKEICMAGRGYDVNGDRARLARTMDTFATRLDALQQGNAKTGVIAPPSFEIEMQLELVRIIWDWMGIPLGAALGGLLSDQEKLSELLYHVEVALQEMNAAVVMYEAY
ncbi:type IV pili methyl-accepting chemotaxis transducer N-terminal domain-containing protein [Pseudooceanicola sp. CBS1P-1]|uniref:NarX-like N-terminal domain-containing protein n=1 Tax=Pseudooceanicola albus TaxID=2692189 RepID=A0A6L7G9W0_9RHOB|nr:MULTISPECIES: type IV pili methyl-accepting chemotaxis transducer N-terminal domain-containing protein [Pseudooceanicola]MBT9384233.1 type IV pili methyl-accepting chemotaxis transducer N-terminal domain-containing protein [Pseudooceanicola endophyticus]MXN20825.1 hypothetical protein [Pseudooceanicola albus]